MKRKLSPPPLGRTLTYGDKIFYKNLSFFDKLFVRKSVCKSKVEVENLYTWLFKLTQNMVQENNEKNIKDPDKVPTLEHLLREKYDTGS